MQTLSTSMLNVNGCEFLREKGEELNWDHIPNYLNTHVIQWLNFSNRN